jgi:hypothetical protein
MPSRKSPGLWRSWLRISVRSLLVLILLLASALGCWMHQVRIQHEAVDAIQRAGGRVIYSWKWRNGALDRFGKPGVPEWLLQSLGPDFFYRVKYVVINADLHSVKYVVIDADFGRRADDSLMTQVGQLRELEVLDLHGNKEVTDIGLARLEGLTTLRFLYLDETGVTDAGLKHLRTMKKLEGLWLANTRVTSTGVEELRRELNQDPPRARISHGAAAD